MMMMRQWGHGSGLGVAEVVAAAAVVVAALGFGIVAGPLARGGCRMAGEGWMEGWRGVDGGGAARGGRARQTL